MTASDGSPTEILRAATATDLAALHAILATDPHNRWTMELLARELALEWSRCDLLEAPVGAEVRALMIYWAVAGELELHHIATHPDHLRRGLAKRLLGHLLAEARRLAATRVFLEVRAGNRAAIALYESHGFLPAGVRRGYYQREGEDAVVFVRETEVDDGSGR